MQRRTYEMLGAVLILLVFGGILWFFLRGEEATPVEETITPSEQVEGVEEEIKDDPAIRAQTPVLLPETNVRIWVERFGSFSTESDYKNIEDIYPLSTDALVAELEAEVLAARNRLSGYYGVSTKVISLEVVEEGENFARMRVTTQRTETIDAPENKTVRYQDILMGVEFIDGGWKVSSYQWE